MGQGGRNTPEILKSYAKQLFTRTNEVKKFSSQNFT
jgi:hypothetical protein